MFDWTFWMLRHHVSEAGGQVSSPLHLPWSSVYVFFFFPGWFVGLLVCWFVGLLLLLLLLLLSCFTHQTQIGCTGDTQAKTTTNKTMTQGRIDSKGKEPGPQIDSSYQRGLPFRREREGFHCGWVDVFRGWVKGPLTPTFALDCLWWWDL